MKTTIFALALASVIVMTSCKQQQPPANGGGEPAGTIQQTASLTPEELGTVGAEISKSPEKADEILAKRGLTRESFERSIRKLSEEPKAAKRYAAAYSKSGA
jgi:hypothetical protein